MPISSTEVSNILQAQIGMFSTSTQYAQAMSAQYGFQSLGGMGVNDPRAATHPAQQSLLAGNLASGVIRGAGYGAGALSLAAGFNLAPRMFDPFFSMPAHYASMGYRLGGLGGAIGMGGMALGGAMAIGSALGYASDQMLTGAQGRSVLNSQIGGMFPNMGINQVGSMSAMVESMNRQGMGGLNELTALMRQGQAAGTLQTGNITEFQASFQKLVGNVRQIANVLNSSINEAHQALVHVKGLGISSDRAAGFITTARGLGQAGGLSPQQMLMAAGQGSQIAQQAGIDRETGAVGAMRTASMFSMVESNKLIEGITAGSQGRFTSAAFRFLGSRQGRSVLGAIMTPGGEYDPEAAAQIAAGSLTPQEIRRMSARNLRSAGSRDAFRARRQELAAEFVSQFGPSGVAPTVSAIAAESGRPEVMRSRLTGLNRRDFGALEQLSSRSASLNQRLTQEALDAFKEGQKQLGVGDIMGVVADKFLGPIRNRFRELGASLTQSVASALDSAANEFVQRPPPRADPRMYAETVRKALLSGTSLSPGSVASTAGILPSQPGGVAGMIRGSVPGAFRFLGAGLQPGTSMSELPAQGFGTESYNPYMTGMALGAIPITPTGSNAFMLAGSAVGSFGKTMTQAFNVPGSGPMGIAGIGPISGTGRLAGFGIRGAGAALRGMGRLLGPVAAPLMALDLMTNVLPERARQAGEAQITQGAVMGSNAEFLRSLESSGVLGADAFVSRQVGAGGLNADSAREAGLTPISGTLSNGQQTFLTPEGKEAFKKHIQQSVEAFPGLVKKYGADKMSRAVELLDKAGRDPQSARGELEGLGIDPSDVGQLITRQFGYEGMISEQERVTKELSAIDPRLLSELQRASMRGDKEVVRRLLETGGLIADDTSSPESDALIDRVVAMEGRNAGMMFLGQQDALTRDLPRVERGIRRAGSIVGVSGLTEGIYDFLEGDLSGMTKDFQDRMEGLTPQKRAELGGLLLEAGSPVGDMLGSFAISSANIRRSIGKSRDPKRIFSAVTRGMTMPDLTREEREFILKGSGEGRVMSDRLSAYLERGALNIMGGDRPGVGEGEIRSLKKTLLEGVRAATQAGGLDSEAFSKLEQQISTTYAPISPGSGKPGGSDRQLERLETVLNSFAARMEYIVGNLPE